MIIVGLVLIFIIYLIVFWICPIIISKMVDRDREGLFYSVLFMHVGVIVVVVVALLGSWAIQLIKG